MLKHVCWCLPNVDAMRCSNLYILVALIYICCCSLRFIGKTPVRVVSGFCVDLIECLGRYGRVSVQCMALGKDRAFLSTGL